MKKSFLIAASLLHSAATFSMDLDTALKLVDHGSSDLRSLIVKYRSGHQEPEVSYLWSFRSAHSFHQKGLFGPILKNKSFNFPSGNKVRRLRERLQSYHEIRFETPLAKSQAREVLKDLAFQENIESAYFSPLIEDPILSHADGEMEVQRTEEPTPNFTHKQDYLGTSPLGVNAEYAWSIPGGTGKNVRIIDIENGTDYEHEDFPPLFYLGELPGGKFDHGTAVRGILNGKNDEVGVTGIAHGASYGFISRLEEFGPSDFHENVSRGMLKAVAMLDKGDVLVLEMHSIGPREEFIPVEHWDHIFDVAKLATSKGIHCVAAAGNGYENLDHQDYKGAFDRSVRDSGCILVGAGSRQKEKYPFSNYGSRVDAFAYERDVVSTGYGDLFSSGEGRDYTKSFSGTSSATPIVAGVVAVASSIAEEAGVSVSPDQMRNLLQRTGVPQSNLKEQNIGNFPNLVELIGALSLDPI